MNSIFQGVAISLSWLAIGCQQGASALATQPLRRAASATPHETVIHVPERLTSVDVGDDASGRPVRVQCETCHAQREPRPLPRNMAALTQFHLGLVLRHGELACSACHAEGQPPRLKLATGATLATAKAMELCAQCHGPQYRDYRHGVHGGMSGHWDLTVGPRVRNHCTDCHDPHAPAILPIAPRPAPRDRFFLNEGDIKHGK